MDEIFKSTADERLRKALIIDEVCLAELDISELEKGYHIMGGKYSTLKLKIQCVEREQNIANAQLLHATQSLSLRKLIEKCEYDEIDKLEFEQYKMPRRKL